MTIDASGWLDPRLAEAMGKTALDWVYGLQHPWAKSPDYWLNACSQHARTKGDWMGNRLLVLSVCPDSAPRAAL